MATAPSTPRSGGHPEPLSPTIAAVEAYFNKLGDDWVSAAQARAVGDQPAQPVDDAVGDGGGGDRMADDQDVDEDDDDADELAEKLDRERVKDSPTETAESRDTETPPLVLDISDLCVATITLSSGIQPDRGRLD